MTDTSDALRPDRPDRPDLPDLPTGVPASALVLTGERTLPGIPDEAYWFARHEVAYRLATTMIATGTRTVLDAGCGEGYGLAMLAEAGATRVVGADLDPQVVDHVSRHYVARYPHVVEAVACELMALPLADDAVDLTVSFQVIEHVHDVPGYLASLRRVTRPGGTVVVATPNRLTFTPGADTPTNPFHVREFTAGELATELDRTGLAVTDLIGVAHGRLLRGVGAITRRPFHERMTTSEPDAWPRAYRTLVRRVRPSWFTLRRSDLDASLDLIAICAVPPDEAGQPSRLRANTATPPRTASEPPTMTATSPTGSPPPSPSASGTSSSATGG